MKLSSVLGVFGRGFTFLSSGGMLADVLALMIVVMVLGGIYYKGRVDANLACARAASTGIENNVKEYGQIKRESNSMDEPSIDRYLSGWMRD